MRASRWITAATLALTFTGCGDAPRQPQTPIAPVLNEVAAIDTTLPPEVPAPTEETAPAPEVAEPRVPPDRSTPPAVVRSIASALDGRDVAALARLHGATATKPRLDEDDLFRVERQFFGPGREAYWRRVLRGVDRDALERATGDQVRLAVQVGGALGQVTLTFVRSDDGWRLGP